MAKPVDGDLHKPKNQTRETIEAELNATETDRLIDLCDEVKRDAYEVEALFRDSSHPCDEWLRAARIDRISELSDAMTKVREAESTSEEACEEAKDQTEHE